MTQFFNNFKKRIVFGPILHFFFKRKTRLSHTTSYRLLTQCQSLEETNDPIPRKCTERRTEGQTGPVL